MAVTTLAFTQPRVCDFLELTKPRLVSLVLLSTAVGFFLASSERISPLFFFVVLLGTSLVAAGSMALNEWIERAEDAKMQRTLSRPIPAGRIEPLGALVFGLVLSAAGFLILFYAANPVTVLFAGLTFSVYLGLYTPLKKITSLCTPIGAIPGALPPLIGWAAVQGRVPYEAWVLFAIIFLWQMPHFLAIAWLYRKDYENAEFKMLSVDDPDGRQVGRQILLYSAALLPVSLLPSVVRMTGIFYFFGALILGIGLVTLGFVGLSRLAATARLLFRGSILYLSLLLLLMVLDRV